MNKHELTELRGRKNWANTELPTWKVSFDQRWHPGIWSGICLVTPLGESATSLTMVRARVGSCHVPSPGVSDRRPTTERSRGPPKNVNLRTLRLDPIVRVIRHRPRPRNSNITMVAASRISRLTSQSIGQSSYLSSFFRSHFVESPRVARARPLVPLLAVV